MRSQYRSFNNRASNRSVYATKSRAPRRTGARGKKYIDPAKFVKPAKFQAEDKYVAEHNFADFALQELLINNVSAKGYHTPSPIQDQAIPIGLAGRDIVGIANTGTGKTAAFALPILHKLMAGQSHRALIIAPTRELAQQIEQECKVYAKGSKLNGAVLIGGSSMTVQIRDLKYQPQIVIGTPGRIKDHTQRGTLDLSKFNIVVLDEVDRMVDMGFITDIRNLLGQLAKPRQSYFFSATLDPNLKNLIDSFLNDPVRISVKTGDTSDNVNQDVMRYNSISDKIDKLHNALLSGESQKTLIFDETQRSVERLYKELLSRGFKVDAIHGGKNQGQRQRALAKFKQSEIDVLVATDVAARGIDVADITHVINYTTPQSYDDYVHRVGRAGRAGRPGQALTFIEA